MRSVRLLIDVPLEGVNGAADFKEDRFKGLLSVALSTFGGG